MPSFEFAICPVNSKELYRKQAGDCIGKKPYPNLGWGKKEVGRYHFVIVHGLTEGEASVMCEKDASMIEKRRICLPIHRLKSVISSGEKIFYDKKLGMDTSGKLT